MSLQSTSLAIPVDGACLAACTCLRSHSTAEPCWPQHPTGPDAPAPPGPWERNAERQEGLGRAEERCPRAVGLGNNPEMVKGYVLKNSRGNRSQVWAQITSVARGLSDAPAVPHEELLVPSLGELWERDLTLSRSGSWKRTASSGKTPSPGLWVGHIWRGSMLCFCKRQIWRSRLGWDGALGPGLSEEEMVILVEE